MADLRLQMITKSLVAYRQKGLNFTTMQRSLTDNQILLEQHFSKTKSLEFQP